MKHTRMILMALMAAALALAVLAGCSSVLAGTVHEDTEQAAALMKEIDTGLAYSTELEAAASRLAEWLVEEPGQLGTQSGQLARKVELTADSGNMTDTNLNEFIDHSSISSNIWVNIPGSVTIGPGRDFLCSACGQEKPQKAVLCTENTNKQMKILHLFA